MRNRCRLVTRIIAVLPILSLVTVALPASPARAEAHIRVGQGYVLAGADGGVFAFGQSSFVGSMAGHQLAAPIVAAGATSDGGGYWLLGRDRGVFALGDAPFYGSQSETSFPPCAGIACAANETPPTTNSLAVGFADEPPNGYAIATADGNIYGYDANMSGPPLPAFSSPVVGLAYSSAHGGTWLACADGEVFNQHGADLYGSAAGIKLAAPITGIVGTPDGQGYWLVGADGGVFAYGNAPFLGSLPGLGVHPFAPVVGIASTPDGGGYWLVGADGGVFAFGDATYLGGMAGEPLAGSIVGIAAP